ncbi:MAG TPA: VOC family protein [Xanthobacteraceae bacterium]|nr:VOC family protein [Xanthobacteraceae bacterium]
MPKHPLPSDTPAVAPYLVVEEPAGLIGFLAEVFGAREVMRVHRGDGSIMHAEVRIRDSAVMMGGANKDFPASTAGLHVYVEDADATYRKALELGGTEIMPPSEAGDGDRRGGFLDAAGNQWWIASRVETLTAAEIEARTKK